MITVNELIDVDAIVDGVWNNGNGSACRNCEYCMRDSGPEKLTECWAIYSDKRSLCPEIGNEQLEEYNQQAAAGELPWAIRSDRFTNPESPVYHVQHPLKGV